MTSLKNAPHSDVLAELERAIRERWPGLNELLKNPQSFQKWLEQWLKDHDLTDKDVEDFFSF